VQRVLAQTRTVLLEASLDLFVNAALDPNAGAVIQFTALRALQPDVFAVCCLLGHFASPFNHQPAWGRRAVAAVVGTSPTTAVTRRAG